MHKKMPCFRLQKWSLIIHVNSENEWNACVVREMRTTQQWAPPQLLMSKYANCFTLAILHLEYVNRPIFLTTCMQRIMWISKSFQFLNQMVIMSRKAILHQHQKCFTFTKIKDINVPCKFALEWQSFIGVNNPHMSSQHHKNMTTSHIHTSLHIPIISNFAQLRCLWIDIHVGLMLIVLLIAGEWVRWN